MAWDRKVALWWIVLFCIINTAWAVSEAYMNDRQAGQEWDRLQEWCQNRRIIFNSTENCDFSILNQELCSFEIVSLHNREQKWMNNVTLKEMLGDWKETSLASTNPYNACIKAGMIVEGYGFGTFEHTQAPPAPGNETSENHGNATITQQPNFSFGCWGCLVIVLGLVALLSAFFFLLAKQNPGYRVGDYLRLVRKGMDSQSQSDGGSINV